MNNEILASCWFVGFCSCKDYILDFLYFPSYTQSVRLKTDAAVFPSLFN